MNSVVSEKVLALLAQEQFIEKNRDLSEQDQIIAAIKEMIPDVTEEEIDNTLAFISSQLLEEKDCELSSEDLDNVAGGFGITLTVTTVLAIIGAASGTGAAIGGAIWYWKHRKCQPE